MTSSDTTHSDGDPAPPGTDAAAAPTLDASFVRAAVVLLLGMLMALLDETIVNVALRSFTADFGAQLSTIQWVTGGYLLAVAVAIPLSGWAVDRFSGKRMWMISVTLFVVGSVLCGLAWSAGSLIAFRIVQGIGGGMIVPVVQTLLARTAGPDRVGKAMGLIAIPLTLGPVLGPVLGGLLVDTASWRWIFLINLPIGLIALALAARVVPQDEPAASGERLDVTGLVLLAPGFAALVFGFTTAAHLGTVASASVVTGLVLAVLLLGGYVVHATTTRNTPLIDLGLFRMRAFTLSLVVMLLVGAVVNAMLFLTPLFFQDPRGRTALVAGLLLAPQGLLGAVGVIVVGKLAGRFTARVTSPVGMLLAGLGMLVYALGAAEANLGLLSAAIAISGFGIGFTVAPTMGFLYQSVGPEAAARATGALFIFNQIGGSLGIALVALMLQTNLATGGPVSAAFGQTFWWIAAFGLVAAIAAIALPTGFRAATEAAAPEEVVAG